VDVSRFQSAICNPFSESDDLRFAVQCDDVDVGGSVIHVTKFQTLIQALGYFKYVLCTGPNNNYFVCFRGQEHAYGQCFQPALYRKCTQEGTRTKRDSLLKQQIAVTKKLCGFEKVDDCIIEGLLQQYGMKTRWIDAVDNIWIALWFACHHAWVWNDGRCDYVHYSLRSVRQENAEGKRPYAYIYVLGFNTGNRGPAHPKRHFMPGLRWGNDAEMLDLRYALPSLAIRPHAQHALLVRSFKNDPNRGRCIELNMSKLVQGVVRIDLEDALEWLGHGMALELQSVFPPAIYDSYYQNLLKGENKGVGMIGKSLEISKREKIVLDNEHVPKIQRIG